MKRRREPARKAKARRKPAKRPVQAVGAAAGVADVQASAPVLTAGTGVARTRAPVAGFAWAPAIALVADPLSPLDWLIDAVVRRKEAGDIPTGRRGAATLFAKQLEKQMAADVKARKCSEALSWHSIRPLLYQKKLWPPE